MKKLLILVILLSSCTLVVDNTEYIVITNIRSGRLGKNEGCYHTAQNMGELSLRMEFFDDCNKYKVGDTIKIVKK